MAFDGRMNIIEINDDEKTVYFETWKPKKITGTKMGGIFGVSDFSTPFKVACELARIYPGDPPNKYIDAGNILEPVLRDYLGHSVTRMLAGPLGVPEGSNIVVEPPVEKEMCQYDHFHDNDMFGGMVDGYITLDGKRNSILEIKTSGNMEKWLDADGNVTVVPDSYMMQASLYAELSHLDRIVFLVGFLQEDDYRWPTRWKPTPENTSIIIVDKMPDIRKKMEEAEEWFREYVVNGYTPEWTDKDAELMKYLRAKPKPQKRR
jgi:hypothetical protein